MTYYPNMSATCVGRALKWRMDTWPRPDSGLSQVSERACWLEPRGPRVSDQIPTVVVMNVHPPGLDVAGAS
jgi:hypothetical protein